MAVMNYSDAARKAVREAMRADDAVWCVGEDLGRGGVFGQYRGLQDEFGPARIADARATLSISLATSSPLILFIPLILLILLP